MKHFLKKALFLASVLLLSVISMVDVAKASSQIKVEGIKISNSNPLPERQIVANSPIELMGPKGGITLNYNLIANATGDNNKLILKIRHSELLIAPSSITISIDGQTIVSKPLHAGNVKADLTIPLTGNALKKGFHSVTISFYGVIKEGVCVDQDSSSNWLTLGIDSYFQLNNQLNDETQALKDFPLLFIGTSEKPVYIVLPDQASLPTLNSGLQVAAYLAEQSNNEQSVQIVRESKLKSLEGNIILLGAKKEFSSYFITSLLKKAVLPENDSALILSRHKLTSGNNSSEALIVTANLPEQIQQRINILTNNQLNTQLTGRQISIEKSPVIKKQENKNTIMLKEFDMKDIVLNSENNQSKHYYYYVPISLNPNDKPSLTLHLKRSELISNLNEKLEEGSIVRDEVELVVLVNNIPHSVNIRSLTKEENGVYTVKLHIKSDAIKENRLIDLQFVSNGLREKKSCVTTDENRWIFLTADSYFKFKSNDTNVEKNPSLAGYPATISGSGIATTIVIPDKGNITDNQLLQLYRSLSINGHVNELNLSKATSVQKEDLKNQNVIFIGGPKNQPLLQEIKNKLIVPYKNDKAQLAEFGFIPEVTEMFSWIQKNPWSKQTNSILVFDTNKEGTPYIGASFLENIKNVNQDATIAVNTYSNQLFTNAEQIEKQAETVVIEEKVHKEEPLQFSIWLVVGLGALLVFAAVLIFVLQKRKKKE
ncbi:cellulose biosynthesis cyclic di-GMP-binding regulatory protein BcsB [Bacillus massiliigorillae]|uniref:cellulose biosynthesis cyclic di-GMP-binding regulatory protein BcsB n=1 Tax=Bacillus massiliigorillae TaxID=1243664 RepID=UPI00039C53BA|nr:cellulose biosynthesis cyclic di-GMP-binding regulatory protein BcsB [Bacillus massiliigorillae]